MNNTIKTTCKLFYAGLLSALLFQGCAVYTPKQPVYYPPPPPQKETKQPVPQPIPVPEPVPVPEAAPSRETSQQISPIAANFSRQANEQIRQGRSDLAAATLERGLRIAPKEAVLWSQLAEIKLQQQQYLQARSLAAKSNSLAGSNTTIIDKNHWIITEALRRAARQ
ncbi:hypothetical protein FCL47_06745 [Desulfopila sp. IMCC35006]|uniref:hypothetical protein n=1 Tax=Desulfopila sp. IMCC35006 TaxID=2569542 RepID=UPI0010AC8A2F|nr:hypothetical protein [Desulfopila sp. IMCC35006]TKB26876.1 hypothetical protein FCL47_06745 [Desulfopila sp. IMCC35006]